MCSFNIYIYLYYIYKRKFVNIKLKKKYVFYIGKVSRAGLFSSTLSSRYDAHTTDSTWVCVFCKQGPHSVIPGDPARPHPNLAGPHIAPGTYTVRIIFFF